MSRRVLLFLRGVLVLLQRRRRRLAQPPSGPSDLLRLLLPLLPHGAEAEHAATASDSILALALAAALRRLPPRLTFDGEEGRDPRLLVEVEGARQLLLQLVLARAPIHADAAAGVAPQVGVPLELYHDAVAGRMARRLLLLVRLLLAPARSADLVPLLLQRAADLVPLLLQRAAEPDQAESEDGTTLLAVLFAAGIRRLPRAPPLAVDLDDPRAVEELVGFFIQRVHAGAVAVAAAAAGEDAPPIHEAAVAGEDAPPIHDHDHEAAVAGEEDAPPIHDHDHEAAVAGEEDAPPINVDLDLLIFNTLLHRARRVAPQLSDNAFALRVLLRLPARNLARLLPPRGTASASLVGVVFYAALRRVDAALPPGSHGFLRDVTNLLRPFSLRLLPPPRQDDHAVAVLLLPAPSPSPLAVEPCPARIAAEMWLAAAAVRAARADTFQDHTVLEPPVIGDDLPARVDKAHEDHKTAKVVILSNLDEAGQYLNEGSISTHVVVDVPPHLPPQEAIDIDAYLTAQGAPSSTLPRGPVLGLLLSQTGKL